MALNFPTSPTNGQVFDNYYYDSSISSWRSNGSKNGLSTRMATEEARSTALELADATTNKSGLVPVIPPTFSTVGGTSSRTGSVVTFTAAGSVSLNNVFTSAYANYQISFESTASAHGIGTSLRMRAAGVDATPALHYYSGARLGMDATVNSWAATADPQVTLGATSQESTTSDIMLINPQRVAKTTFESRTNGYYGPSNTYCYFILRGFLNHSVQYDGFSILLASGNFTGTIRVYGYNS
jgi:hypothetical protein